MFLDGAHFVMGCDFLGYIYGKTRRFIKTFSGRKRYNVLGALNFVTKKVTTVTNDTYITAAEVCQMLPEFPPKLAHTRLLQAGQNGFIRIKGFQYLFLLLSQSFCEAESLRTRNNSDVRELAESFL